LGKLILKGLAVFAVIQLNKILDFKGHLLGNLMDVLIELAKMAFLTVPNSHNDVRTQFGGVLWHGNVQ
jgi:hypothetical protein